MKTDYGHYLSDYLSKIALIYLVLYSYLQSILNCKTHQNSNGKKIHTYRSCHEAKKDISR